MLRKDIRPEKNRLREEMKAFRRALTTEAKEKKDSAIRRNIQKMKEYQNCDTLITFVSTPIEVDTHQLILRALDDGKKVAVPYCVPGTRQMEFYCIRSLDDLSPRTFGVLEPDPASCEKLGETKNSLCIVPGLAFDRQGYRLGYGKGYYDRFLSRYDGFKVGVVYEGCFLTALPHGYYDVAVDLLITEKRRKKPLPSFGRRKEERKPER